MYKIVKDIEILRTKSIDATPEESSGIISNLVETLTAHANGVGLSAIQIGIPKRIAVIKDDSGHHAIINPTILTQEEEFVHLGEGCLSMPNKFHDVARYKHFIIENNVLDGDLFRKQIEYYYYDTSKDEWNSGIAAIAVQHEIDHFDGKLISDWPKISERKLISSNKVGRNDPCPCGSLKKFKKCCGK